VRRPPGGRSSTSGGEGASVCMRYIFILNEIWAQDKIYILVGTSQGLNMKLLLFYDLNFAKVYINLEKRLVHLLNFMSICLFKFIHVEGV
jgi:hypothetical protein